MIESSVVAVLLADTAVTDIVGDRITPGVIEVEAGLPGINVMRAAGSRSYTFGGGIDATISISVSCWAQNWRTARPLAELVRAALDAYSGGDILAASVTDGADVPDLDVGIYGCVLIVDVQTTEAE